MTWPLKNRNGQGLIETIIVLPVLFTLMVTVSLFLYEQIWIQVITHLLHEVIICEQTLSARHCLIQANRRANSYNLLGTVWIFKKNQTYHAELFILRTLKWKSLSVEKNLPSEPVNKKASFSSG